MKQLAVSSQAILLLTVILISGCATVQKHWETAQSQDTISAYEEFLIKHPNSEFTDRARTRLDQLATQRDWEEASSQDTISSYEEFLRKHPGSEFTSEVYARIDQLRIQADWEEARSQDSISAYEEFLRKHSTSEFVSKAHTRINKLRIQADWKEARSRDTISGYKEFFRKYPASEFARRAHTQIDLLTIQRHWNIESYNELTNPAAFVFKDGDSLFCDILRHRGWGESEATLKFLTHPVDVGYWTPHSKVIEFENAKKRLSFDNFESISFGERHQQSSRYIEITIKHKTGRIQLGYVYDTSGFDCRTSRDSYKRFSAQELERIRFIR